MYPRGHRPRPTYALAPTGLGDVPRTATARLSTYPLIAYVLYEFRGNGEERAEYHNVVVWV